MPDPVEIDMSTVSGPWPAFTITGATGTGASGVNATYFLQPFNGTTYTWTSAAGATVTGIEDGSDWAVTSSATEYFTSATGQRWPWLATWTPAGGAGGTLAFAEGLAPPVTVEVAGEEAVAQATWTTAMTGTNNDLVFTAVPAGRLGNGIRVQITSAFTANQTLLVSVNTEDPRWIIIRPAANGSEVITSTAAQIKAAIEASAVVSALVTVAHAPGNDGTGVVTATTLTYLTGGTGGLPPAPTAVTI